ncbi:glycosyltransferase family 1 protein [Mycobacterium sp. WMMD1722]|uniref:glycosyltransferase family 1 protein n=1 Tax=Mycobacterium sp. WMMD1722 TaxID=3404117 RepID=UPI003BF5BBDF
MIAVASVPAAHPYVRTITDPDSVVLLDDPRPVGATLPGQWWPPRLLEPDYLAGHADRFDVLHVHFGYDSTPPAVLREVIAVLNAGRTPLVVTVHDLHNPHFADPREHLARLDVLIPAADAVVTLTAGAADAIADRWGRRATVVAHPHVLALDAVGAPRPVRTVPVVAVHAKSLRANIDPLPVLEVLLAAEEPAWRLRLDVDDDAHRSARAGVLPPQRLDDLRARGVEVRVHPRFTDAQLQQYLTEIDALVLPYRFGTHSGWVEAGHDAGVAVIVPRCGYLHEQHGDPSYEYRTDEAQGLIAAIRTGLAAAQPLCEGDPDRRRQRERQLRDVRREMTRLYRTVLANADAA